MKLVLFFVPHILATIDLNFAELEYLASHLLPEECRRLVAAAHFKAYMMPNAVGQAGTPHPLYYTLYYKNLKHKPSRRTSRASSSSSTGTPPTVKAGAKPTRFLSTGCAKWVNTSSPMGSEEQ